MQFVWTEWAIVVTIWRMALATASPSFDTITPLLGPHMTAEQARVIFDAGPDAVIFALLTLARQIALTTPAQPPAGTDPACPSGQAPPYAKPNHNRRRKTPGAKPGHPGRRRARPEPNRVPPQ